MDNETHIITLLHQDKMGHVWNIGRESQPILYRGIALFMHPYRRIKFVLGRMTSDNLAWTGVEVSPFMWESLLEELEHLPAVPFRCETSNRGAIILVPAFGKFATVRAVNNLSDNLVRVVNENIR